MKLKVENFGPIRKADVVVGPMTVFVGPSNTGKSYLAILIYSVMKTFDQVADTWFLPHRVASALFEKMQSELQAGAWFKNKRTVLHLVDELFDHWVDRVTKTWKDQVLYCFGEEGKSMIKDIENLVIKISDVQGNLEFALHARPRGKKSRAGKKLLSRYKQHFFVSLHEDGPVNSRFKRYLQYQEDFARSALAGLADELEETRGFLEMVNHEIIETVANELNLQLLSMLMPATDAAYAGESKSYYLPAVRGGIMQSHRTLVSALIKRAPRAGLRAISSIPPFNGVLSDFMEQLLAVRGKTPVRVLARQRRRAPVAVNKKEIKKEIQKIGGELEEKIMQGQIDVQMSDLDYPDFRYTFQSGGKKHELPLMSVSSMVSELAPVSLFIHRYVNPGDLFIVEEPEAHLHPAAQRKIAGTLVQLVNAGVCVLITTHSDTMLEQLGNFVHASVIGAKVPKQALSQEKIAAYSFARPKTGKQKNTVVKTISFDKDTGFLSTDHLDASSDLYNESVDLFNAGQAAVEDAAESATEGKKNAN